MDGDGTPLTLNLRFPGQYYDQESGLNYNYFRDYDPAMGRYVQSDPIGLGGGLNTFGYVGANSLVNIDPYGLRTDSLTASCRLHPEICAAAPPASSQASGAANAAGLSLWCLLTNTCSANEAADGEGGQCPVDGGIFDETNGQGTDFWDIPGDYDDALDAAEKLADGNKFEDKGDGVKVTTDANGNKVVVRPGGGGKFRGGKANATVEIQPSNGGPPIDKIRFR